MEITREQAVWYYNNSEIDVYRDETAAEAAIRRAMRYGWTTDVLVDADGTVMEMGIPTPHSIKIERRNMYGLESGR